MVEVHQGRNRITKQRKQSRPRLGLGSDGLRSGGKRQASKRIGIEKTQKCKAKRRQQETQRAKKGNAQPKRRHSKEENNIKERTAGSRALGPKKDAKDEEASLTNGRGKEEREKGSRGAERKEEDT